ncbi:MAG: bifunctional (p)ppGpp synthetase/guanosine-3',5'-bis(diphosphate) 3'-pyrophosphohydrolase [Oscillospiraceae bacterium]|nr:bifunctional (p)ppGpp synthetase/guanosine-3',5'-bis(diphosphate) 3'-pyrophosphohydrolase [Oscillospiraceae bacterium]
MNYTLDGFLEKVAQSEKNYDISRITSAYEMADAAHEGQKRNSGEAYISHPFEVALILLEMCMDTETIMAALLHDVVEDTDIKLDIIRKKFGEDVATLVDGVTKISNVTLNTSKEEEEAENIRKVLIAMSNDIRVIVIKLADRIHNIRTLEHNAPEKQKIFALETMSFYSPIAHRLGMARIKEELEDTSLRYLDPYAFREIVNKLALHKEARDEFIERIKERIIARVSDMEPPPVIEGRVKGIYSLYKKEFVDGKSFDEIYDLYAVRIIVQSDIDCYNVLGVIHDMFTPIPYRFKDYIATPKANRYQSLHTTVLGREGVPFEVQIRTEDMHNTAQLGVAAHWKYKSGLNIRTTAGERFDWIRQLLEQQQEADDVEQFAEAIKIGLAPDEVYMFTPRGDVINLPAGSTALDFAYAIHTQVGHKMTGVKVDGRMVSFDHRLKTGDIVEIKTTNSESYGPNISWLEYVKTTEAKGKIRSWLKKEKREESIEEGQKLVKSELKAQRIVLHEEGVLWDLAEKHRFKSLDDLYAAIGTGGVEKPKMSYWIKEFFKPEIPEQSAHGKEKRHPRSVIVEGIEDCLIKYSHCCNPLPGDDIIGFVTRGYGVSIHKKECENALKRVGSPEEYGRLLTVAWADNVTEMFNATLDVTAQERTGLIADITSMVSGNKVSISGFNARILKNGNANVHMTVEITGSEQLCSIITKMENIDGVISVERTGK